MAVFNWNHQLIQHKWMLWYNFVILENGEVYVQIAIGVQVMQLYYATSSDTGEEV